MDTCTTFRCHDLPGATRPKGKKCSEPVGREFCDGVRAVVIEEFSDPNPEHLSSESRRIGWARPQYASDAALASRVMGMSAIDIATCFDGRWEAEGYCYFSPIKVRGDSLVASLVVQRFPVDVGGWRGQARSAALSYLDNLRLHLEISTRIGGSNMTISRAVLEEIAKKYIVTGRSADTRNIYFQVQDGPLFLFASDNRSVAHPILINGMIQALQEAVAASEDTVSAKEKSVATCIMDSFDNGYLAAVQNLAEKIGLSKEGTKEQVCLRIVDFFLTVEDQKGDIAKEAHANGIKDARDNMRLELQRLRDKSVKQAAEAKATGEKLVLEAKEAIEKSAWLSEEAATYDGLLANLNIQEAAKDV